MTHVRKSALIAALVALAPALASANTYRAETKDGMRHIIPKEDHQVVPEVAMIQKRAIEMGLFTWPAPTEKVEIDQLTRPREVGDCAGHDAGYIPTHQREKDSDPLKQRLIVATTQVYEWMAYRNAIAAQDCSCDHLKADWPQAVATSSALHDGVSNWRYIGASTRSMRTTIHKDFKRMCDVTMPLVLE